MHDDQASDNALSAHTDPATSNGARVFRIPPREKTAGGCYQTPSGGWGSVDVRTARAAATWDRWADGTEAATVRVEDPRDPQRAVTITVPGDERGSVTVLRWEGRRCASATAWGERGAFEVERLALETARVEAEIGQDRRGLVFQILALLLGWSMGVIAAPAGLLPAVVLGLLGLAVIVVPWKGRRSARRSGVRRG